MEINQKLLEEQIEILEKWYVVSTIELMKFPIFLEQIDKEIKVCNKEKKKQLEILRENNLLQEKWHKESLENTEKILEKVYKLRT